jgi:hypothetical protein
MEESSSREAVNHSKAPAFPYQLLQNAAQINLIGMATRNPLDRSDLQAPTKFRACEQIDKF